MERIGLIVKKLLIPLVILMAFWGVAIFLWLNTGKPFYLLNFGYIGAAVALGLGLYIILPRKRKALGRRIAQLLVGVYMLVFLGLFGKENMQIEGFFFHLLAGYFAASVIPCCGFLRFMHLNCNNCDVILLKSEPSGCFQN